MASSADAPRIRRRIGVWLAAWSVMLLLTVLIGGLTRLTDAGLSITEWRPVAGVIPPFSQDAWDAEFARYQAIPEYRQVYPDMTLDGFKRIYLWEYGHRLWARLVGLAFAVPLLVFLARGWLQPPYRSRLLLLLALTGAQGAMGWYMVKSGLAVRTDVSQYRLAAHLALALVIYAITVWTASELLAGAPERGPGGSRVRSGAAALTALAFVTAISGAFVAGLDAGKAYNTFPLMGGRLVPAGYAQLDPWYRNLFEHVPAVQFNHRLLGTVLVLAAVFLWGYARRVALPPRARRLAGALPLVVLAQAGLGITTLLLGVPVAVAVVHQGGAVLVLTTALLLTQSLAPPRISG